MFGRGYAGLGVGGETEKATLEWLVEALEHAHAEGHTKLVGYLEEVTDEVVFETEWMARRASLVG
jgi:hypothetical protein